MIVASCRDETPRELPQAMRPLRLSRLGVEEMSAACTALIGPRSPPELVRLLSRETEGNAFFLVEALRALAEEAGSLRALATAALPERIFAGGIQALLLRHLGAVSDSGRPLLRAAALLGRGVDVGVLRALEPEADLDASDRRVRGGGRARARRGRTRRRGALSARQVARSLAGRDSEPRAARPARARRVGAGAGARRGAAAVGSAGEALSGGGQRREGAGVRGARW
ncbi:MAG: hypothetical protein QM756_16045 [Polyangiaceae bacterium]